MRRIAIVGLVLIGLTLPAVAQEEGPAPDRLAQRYGMQVNPLSYPQKTPEEALKAVVRALEKKSMEYLLAQLADPKFVDGRIAEYRQAIPTGSEQGKIFLAFDRLQRETEDHFFADPQLLRELRILARDAKWDTTENQATGAAEAIPGHKVYLRRIGERWFLENRQ
jgi:hypothetical protein